MGEMKRAMALASVGLDCAMSVAGVLLGILHADARTLIGGAALRLVGVIALAMYALRGRQWARIILVVIEGFTALLALALISIVNSSHVNSLILLGMSLAFAGMAIAIGLWLRPHRTSLST